MTHKLIKFMQYETLKERVGFGMKQSAKYEKGD